MNEIVFPYDKRRARCTCISIERKPLMYRFSISEREEKYLDHMFRVLSHSQPFNLNTGSHFCHTILRKKFVGPQKFDTDQETQAWMILYPRQDSEHCVKSIFCLFNLYKACFALTPSLKPFNMLQIHDRFALAHGTFITRA